MVLASQVNAQLQLFAESFTGQPTRLIISSLTSQEAQAQTQDFMRVYIPYEIKVGSVEKSDELSFAVFKGLVALQSSAALYKGIPDVKRFPDYCEKLRVAGKEQPPSTLEELLLAADQSHLLASAYRTFELARRMQCIGQDYRVLAEDMREGFSNMFNPELFVKNHPSSDLSSDISLALARVYWNHLGVNDDVLEDVHSKLPSFSGFEQYRREVYRVLCNLSVFENPLASSCETTLLERVVGFRDYLSTFVMDAALPNPFVTMSIQDMIQQQKTQSLAGDRSIRAVYTDTDKVPKLLEDRKRELLAILKEVMSRGKSAVCPVGLDIEEAIQLRLGSVERELRALREDPGKYYDALIASQNSQSFGHSKLNSFKASLDEVFRDVPLSAITHLEAPEIEHDVVSGKTFFFPEVREGKLVQRAVRVQLYDLHKDQPPSQQDLERTKALERTIGNLESHVTEYNKKIHSEINYVYDDLQDIIKRRDRAQQELRQLQRELRESKKIHAGVSRAPFSVDYDLARRVVREMERIRPEKRSIVRRCFEGELDHKAYFDYLLELEAGGDPLPTFHFQWRKNTRDVASIVLLDASASSGQIVEGKRVLDYLKEAAYYLATGAIMIGDKLAVLAYNGDGPSQSRVFVLKNFQEGLPMLRDRLELLHAELNNRDGSAIRCATQHLLQESAKTRFLFHVTDMQPSDIKYEELHPAIVTCPYDGVTALEDVVHACSTARSQGIIPVGICIKNKVIPKPTEIEPLKSRGKINPAVLEKLRQIRARSMVEDITPQLRKMFKNNYHVISNLNELQTVLKNAYLGLSFI